MPPIPISVQRATNVPADVCERTIRLPSSSVVAISTPGVSTCQGRATHHTGAPMFRATWGSEKSSHPLGRVSLDRCQSYHKVRSGRYRGSPSASPENRARISAFSVIAKLLMINFCCDCPCIGDARSKGDSQYTTNRLRIAMPANWPTTPFYETSDICHSFFVCE